MAVDSISEKFRSRRPGALELSCSWCGSAVPLPAGEFSGVCIDCGTVMFRGSLDIAGASEHNCSWGTIASLIPAPVV